MKLYIYSDCQVWETLEDNERAIQQYINADIKELDDLISIETIRDNEIIQAIYDDEELYHDIEEDLENILEIKIARRENTDTFYIIVSSL